MQSQFGSLSLVAQAYEQELRADAARVRMKRTGGPDGVSGWAKARRVRRAIGRGLIAIGRRCRGSRNTIAGGDGASVPSMP